MRRNSDKGFTLIELMIVIAIIAIIAAIAIPGLLQSQRASNERNASASLKTLTTAEADFRANDRDANRIQDFWTGNVSGLYGLIPIGTTEMIKLIEISVGSADYNSTVVGGVTAGTPGTAAANTSTVVLPTVYSIAAPKAGYWYKACTTDEATPAVAYSLNTNGVIDATGGLGATNGRNHSKFAFFAFPDSYSSGRGLFFVNEGNTVFKRPVINNVKPSPTVPSATNILGTGYSGSGTRIAEIWPTDTQLKQLYSKLD